MTSRQKKITGVVLAVAVLTAACIIYVQALPLVFNESLFSHAHCIKGGGLGLEGYAQEHGGMFPFHTNGYGDALVLVNDGCDEALTGPGYDARVLSPPVEPRPFRSLKPNNS